MSRTLKPQEVEKIHIPNSLSEFVILYLDRNVKDFFCDIHGEVLRSPDFPTLKKVVEDKIKNLEGLTWMPIIQVTVQRQIYLEASRSERKRYADLSLEISRFYVSLNHNRQWLRAEWDVPENERSRNNKWANWGGTNRPANINDIPFHSKGNEQHFLPYSENLWAGLNRIVEKLNELRNQVAQALGDNQNVQNIEKIGSDVLGTLLPAGWKKKEEKP